MPDRPLPTQRGDWDNPQSLDAPSPETVDLVTALTVMGARLPVLIKAMSELHRMIPAFAMDAMLSKMPPNRWAAMAALCDEPGRILLDLATLCRTHPDRAISP